MEIDEHKSFFLILQQTKAGLLFNEANPTLNLFLQSLVKQELIIFG